MFHGLQFGKLDEVRFLKNEQSIFKIVGIMNSPHPLLLIHVHDADEVNKL